MAAGAGRAVVVLLVDTPTRARPPRTLEGDISGGRGPIVERPLRLAGGPPDIAIRRGGPSVTPPNDTGVRVLVVTASGSVYAVRHDAESGWWLRARAVPSRNAPLLRDAWRPIHQPVPWPPALGSRVTFEFLDERSMSFDEWPGLIVTWENEWRTTTEIRDIHTWSPADAWPGEPTDEPKEEDL